MRTTELQVSDDAAGQRLDKFLRRALGDVPLGHIFRLLRTRRVRVNGVPAKAAQLLLAGDTIVIRGVESSPTSSRSAARSRTATPTFRTVFEDEYLLIVDKPAGLAVHTGSGISGATLVDEVRAYLGVSSRLPVTEFSPSPAHRLDRDTSGLVVVAKTRRCMVPLAAMFSSGAGVTKTYVALARGRLEQREGSIDLALAERGQSESSRREHGPNLQPAVTRFRVIESTAEASLLRLVIDTGRTHQIRRHLEALGHPVAGDRRYGDGVFNRFARVRWGLSRMFLHARTLEMSHPISGARLRFDAALPEELEAVLQRAGFAFADTGAGRV